MLVPVGNTFGGNPREPRPLSLCSGFPVICNVHVATPVVRLLLICCPPNIVRFVVTVVVYAVKAMTVSWAVAYINQEILEVIAPSIAYSDPSPRIGGMRNVFSHSNVVSCSPICSTQVYRAYHV